jgi:hypothetical protein
MGSRQRRRSWRSAEELAARIIEDNPELPDVEDYRARLEAFLRALAREAVPDQAQ